MALQYKGDITVTSVGQLWEHPSFANELFTPTLFLCARSLFDNFFWFFSNSIKYLPGHDSSSLCSSCTRCSSSTNDGNDSDSVQMTKTTFWHPERRYTMIWLLKASLWVYLNLSMDSVSRGIFEQMSWISKVHSRRICSFLELKHRHHSLFSQGLSEIVNNRCFTPCYSLLGALLSDASFFRR